MSETREILESIFSFAELKVEDCGVIERLSAFDASRLVRCLYRECKGSPFGKQFLPQIVWFARRSDVSIEEWVADLLCVYDWLESQSCSARLADVLEYISCAREGSSAQSGYSIEWYLHNYGFAARYAITLSTSA